MKILALNSAFPEADIALSLDGEKKFAQIDSNCKHSENMLVQIDNVLGENNIADIDVISVVVGPGSFTGIRIGVALAKGFMVANPKLKAVACSSLELMAYIFGKTKPKNGFTCIINALSGNYFAQTFDKFGNALDNAKMVFGDELENIKENFIIGLKCENTEFANDNVEFNPQTLLEFTQNKIGTNSYTPENLLLPVYLRLSQAEQNLKDKGE